MRFSRVARLAATGAALGIAGYLPLAASASTEPAGATGGWFSFFAQVPHGACAAYGGVSDTLYHAQWYGPGCDTGVSYGSDAAIKENIVPVVW